MYCFGADIGGTACKLGIFKDSGELLVKWEIPTSKEDNGKSVLADVVHALEEKREELQIKKQEIQGIGIGVPGPVLEDGTVRKCINLGWDIVQVREEMKRLCDYPVEVGNDANMAALGEAWQGAGAGCENMFMVTLGTGVGGGIVLNGNIVYGSAGAGGEFGHMLVNAEEKERCACGKCGCLEQYASATGIVRMAKKYYEKNPGTGSLSIEHMTAKDIFDAAKAEDKAALMVTEQFFEILSTALANVACVVNPEVIVIGGGVSKAGQFIIDGLFEKVLAKTFHACRNVRLELAELGNDAGIYGGAASVLRRKS